MFSYNEICNCLGAKRFNFDEEAQYYGSTVESTYYKGVVNAFFNVDVKEPLLSDWLDRGDYSKMPRERIESSVRRRGEGEGWVWCNVKMDINEPNNLKVTIDMYDPYGSSERAVSVPLTTIEEKALLTTMDSVLRDELGITLPSLLIRNSFETKGKCLSKQEIDDNYSLKSNTRLFMINDKIYKIYANYENVQPKANERQQRIVITDYDAIEVSLDKALDYMRKHPDELTTTGRKFVEEQAKTAEQSINR